MDGRLWRNDAVSVGTESSSVYVYSQEYALGDAPEALYTVTLNPNNGTEEVENISNISKGSKVKVWSPETYGFTIPEGKTFEGWLIDEEVYGAGEYFEVKGNTTAVAQWSGSEPVTHTVTFNLNGGQMTSPLTQVVNHGEVATRPTPNPTKEKFSFIGWYIPAVINGENNMMSYDFTTPVTKDITIYADWEEIFTLTFDFNGGTRNGEGTYVVNWVGFGMFLTEDNLVTGMEVTPP